MSKISVQQRKYFTERIQNAINNKISVLKHKNASRVTKMGNKQFDNYLNEIEIKDQLDRFKEVQEEYNELSQNISLIYSNIKKALNISNYESGWKTLYKQSEHHEMLEAFRRCCEEVALQDSEGSSLGKQIEILEKKKRAATDVLHGINELEGLTAEVNRILKGSDIPLLGE